MITMMICNSSANDSDDDKNDDNVNDARDGDSDNDSNNNDNDDDNILHESENAVDSRPVDTPLFRTRASPPSPSPQRK